MPDSNGRDLLEQIKQEPLLRNIPVILMPKPTLAIEDMKELGFADFIPKPFGEEVLMEKIHSYLAICAQPPKKVKISELVFSLMRELPKIVKKHALRNSCGSLSRKN